MRKIQPVIKQLLNTIAFFNLKYFYMKKTTLVLAPLKPRNPFVAKAALAKAGKHIRTEKTVRQKQKKAIAQELAKSKSAYKGFAAHYFIQSHTAFN